MHSSRRNGTVKMTNPTSEAHKYAAVQFLKLVTSGNIDEAYRKYVDMNGKHHNCYFPAGLSVLKQAMIENNAQFPSKKFDIKNVLGDGDMVAVHSHLRMKESESGMVTVHLFRFTGDKIAEFWDCGQQIPADMPNEDGAF